MSGASVGVRAALDARLVTARATHPATWVDDDRFCAHALERAGGDEAVAERIEKLHAEDLYLAVACADGNAAAIASFEQEHMAHVADFVARIDSSIAFADEVRQRLRTRLLVRSEDGPPRILTYSGAGPIGGWLRVCAVREAREMAGRRGNERELDTAAGTVDPELAWLKAKYGDLVSVAFKKALDGLTADERTMLRMHYLDGLTLEQVASLFRVSRATGARALAKARSSIVDAVRRELKTAVGVETSSADSLLAFVRSRIEIDLAKHLG